MLRRALLATSKLSTSAPASVRSTMLPTPRSIASLKLKRIGLSGARPVEPTVGLLVSTVGATWSFSCAAL